MKNFLHFGGPHAVDIEYDIHYWQLCFVIADFTATCS